MVFLVRELVYELRTTSEPLGTIHCGLLIIIGVVKVGGYFVQLSGRSECKSDEN